MFWGSQKPKKVIWKCWNLYYLRLFSNEKLNFRFIWVCEKERYREEERQRETKKNFIVTEICSNQKDFDETWISPSNKKNSMHRFFILLYSEIYYLKSVLLIFIWNTESLSKMVIFIMNIIYLLSIKFWTVYDHIKQISVSPGVRKLLSLN